MSTRRSSTLSKAEIIRRGLELGLDYGLTHSCYDPGAGRARRAGAATAACCAPGDSPKPASPTRCSWAKIARIRLRILSGQPHPPSGRRGRPCALLMPFALAAVWSANRTRVEREDEARASRPASVAATAGGVSRPVPDRPRLDGVGARAPSGRDRARRAECDPAVRGVLRDQPLLLNIVAHRHRTATIKAQRRSRQATSAR